MWRSWIDAPIVWLDIARGDFFRCGQFRLTERRFTVREPRPIMKILVNDQIHLSEFAPSDKAACVEHLREKAIYDRTLRIPYPYTEADFDTWLGIVEQSTKQQGQPVNWAIRDADGCLIGGTGFDSLQIGKSHRAEIGYWLAKPFWGSGIMTSVVAKACEFALDEWGLTKITAHVFANNPASARVLEKCGFELEGYLKRHYLKDRQFIDAKVYGLLK